jgi:hypothetical protein
MHDGRHTAVYISGLIVKIHAAVHAALIIRLNDSERISTIRPKLGKLHGKHYLNIWGAEAAPISSALHFSFTFEIYR